jgi:hypothetical protein
MNYPTPVPTRQMQVINPIRCDNFNARRILGNVENRHVFELFFFRRLLSAATPRSLHKRQRAYLVEMALPLRIRADNAFRQFGM